LTDRFFALQPAKTGIVTVETETHRRHNAVLDCVALTKKGNTSISVLRVRLNEPAKPFFDSPFYNLERS